MIEIIGECTKGLTAVDAIKTRQPDVLFLDIHMPGMDGFSPISGSQS